VLAVASVAAACTDAKVEPTTGVERIGNVTTTSPPPLTPTGKLNGLHGTAPAADPPADFAARLKKIDPSVTANVDDAARPYDITIIAALAAEQARTDSPGRIANQIIDITTKAKRCSTYKLCRERTDAGAPLRYEGATGPIDMLPNGEPADATFGVYKFDASDRLVQTGVKSNELSEQAKKAVIPNEPDPNAGPKADGVFKVGMVFPTEGDLARVAAAQRAGVRLAIDEINAEGGVVGVPAQLLDGDSGKGDSAATAALQLVQQGADVIIGGSASSDTDAMLGPVTDARVILFAPSATAASLVTAEDHGLFFRLAPSDVLQGGVLASVVADDGLVNVTVIAENSTYGKGLALSFGGGFTPLGGNVLNTISFEPGEPAPDVVARALAAPADGYVILADATATGAVLDEFVGRGKSPSQIPMYVANISTSLAAAVRNG